MENKILEILKNNKSLTIYDINDLLELKSSEELRNLQEILKQLEGKFLVYRSKKNKYMLFDDSDMKKGRLSVHRSGRFGFVEIEGQENDIRIDSSNFNGAIHNDIVIVDVIKPKTNEGKILRVVERQDQDLVGEFYIKDGIGYVKMDNPRYKDYIIDLKDSKGAVDGHKVIVKRAKEINPGNFQGEIVKILGHKNDVGVDILSMVYEYGIPNVFPDEVMAEVEKIPSEVSAEDLVGRRDLREELIFTIDPETAKDFDQAITARKKDNGNYHLGVHIADVTNYVKEDSAIGKEAYNRGNSVYLVDRVIPALPHRLSNGICSLNEGVDRLTLSCEMEIDSNGNVVKYDIFPSVIRSKKRMTYDNADKILENNEIPEGYEPFADTLRLMAELGSVLRKNKVARGYLEFGTDEMKIVVDEKGDPIYITKRETGLAENFNEDLMVAANETVATHFHMNNRPLVYRIHEKPDEKKVTQFITFLNGLGYRIKGSGKNFTSSDMQKMLNMLKDKEEWRVLGNMALRTMKKACYSPNNVGHYGLGLKYYAHFTAPIRRSSDLMVHRELKGLLGVPGFRNNYTYEELTVYSEHVSLTEDRSVKCERAVEKYEAAKYMEKHIGEEYDAIISSISREGIWVQLDNLIEGLIKVSEIGNDYYDIDEVLQIAKGRKTGKYYHIGQKLHVVVASASKEASEIDFAITDNINQKVKIKK
jgi:ribonuclease R